MPSTTRTRTRKRRPGRPRIYEKPRVIGSLCPDRLYTIEGVYRATGLGKDSLRLLHALLTLKRKVHASTTPPIPVHEQCLFSGPALISDSTLCSELSPGSPLRVEALPPPSAALGALLSRPGL
jgi:hypothetical protein